ncbi:methyltransferase domain-containing protein [Aquimarina sp. SS2-1]|uniref:methyltransferase domain-containing protein n=1 Tax=Aquimarina besae TaxID=3342247 RepID=UPI00366FB4CF
MNFRTRLHTTEQLDNLSLSGPALLETLSSLKLINKLFGNHKQIAKSVLEYCLEQPGKKCYRIIDLGCGGGDSVYHISKKTNLKEINVSFLGIDGNPQSIAVASTKYARNDYIKFSTANILDSSFSVPYCDLIISSHFVYHFKDDELITFIKKAKQKGVKHMIFSELKRSSTAYFLFKFSSVILPISKIAKNDGLIAIQRAFTVKELKNILKQSGVKNYTVEEKIWFRTITKIEL